MKAKFMIAIGWMCVGLGMIGVVVPVLPTTPFLLLAATLFARNSKKYEAWLKSTKVYKNYVVPFKTKGGLTLRTKIEITLTSFTILMISGIVVSTIYIRLLLLFIGCCHLFVIIRIPTIKPEEKSDKSEQEVS
ncbi:MULTISPECIES: YbaN family protein [Bacillus]|uniref:YbaN family protein n=1 Tax=Bacillus TaxID=1386 RepID=UPI0002E26772|nr:MULTISPECIES: YbaN family protein [Bacillus]